MITKKPARSLGALLAATLLFGGVALSFPSAPAHAATPTQLTHLSFSWSGGLLARTQVKIVTVSLTLVDPDGIPLSSVGVAISMARPARVSRSGTSTPPSREASQAET